MEVSIGVCIEVCIKVCIGVCIGGVKHTPFHEFLKRNSWKQPFMCEVGMFIARDCGCTIRRWEYYVLIDQHPCSCIERTDSSQNKQSTGRLQKRGRTGLGDM